MLRLIGFYLFFLKIMINRQFNTKENKLRNKLKQKHSCHIFVNIYF